MMTARQYVEDKVKSYTLLANRCRREAAKKEEPARAPTRTSPKSDGIYKPHHPEE